MPVPNPKPRRGMSRRSFSEGGRKIQRRRLACWMFAHGDQSALQPHRTPDAAASTASHPASVTIAIRPSYVERDGRSYEVCLPNEGSKIFFAMGVDSPNHTKSSPSGYRFLRGGTVNPQWPVAEPKLVDQRHEQELAARHGFATRQSRSSRHPFWRIIRRAIALCEYRISPNLRLAFSRGVIGKLPHSPHWRVS
jgi:hypothetical protein